jgi:hypothetical protein
MTYTDNLVGDKRAGHMEEIYPHTLNKEWNSKLMFPMGSK